MTFFQLILYAHIVTAAKNILSYNFTNTASDLARDLVANYVLLPETDAATGSSNEPCDKVNLYACETLTLGLLWHGFYDAIKEGDGDRILRYWRFLLIIFKSSNHPNYAKEAIIPLMQYTYLFSERKKAQLLWSRCVNTKGEKGCNMPCDLSYGTPQSTIENNHEGHGRKYYTTGHCEGSEVYGHYPKSLHCF